MADADGILRLAYCSRDPTERPPMGEMLAFCADLTETR
jgi:hypothetical protein